MAENLPPPDECANCGAALPRNARACPGCGADERTGWREQSVYDDLDLPDTAFEDDTPSPPGNKAPAWLWPVVGVILLFAVVATFVFRR